MKPTIVTAYYRFPSKHTYEEYDKWIADFAATFDTPVVFFGEEDWCRKFKSMRGDRPTHCVPLAFEHLYCRELTDWRAVLEKDKFKHLHCPELYIIWNEKSNLVKRALDINSFKSEHFAWMDVGCVRNGVDKTLNNWPNTEKLHDGKIAIALAEPFRAEDFNIDDKTGLPPDFHGKNRFSGAMMLGDWMAWRKWIPAFYDTVDAFIKHGRNCGLDQNAITATALLNSGLVQDIFPPENVNKWFYLHQYFA